MTTAHRLCRRHWSRRITGYNHCKQLSRVREPKCRASSARACARSSKPALDLPPPFRLVTLREVGDAFAHATKRRGGGGGRHAGLCGPLRSRGIRRRAGARGAAEDRAARALCRARRARRRARGARSARASDHLRLAGRGARRWRARRRRPPRLAAGRGRERAAGVARVRRHDPHRGDGRGGTGPAAALGGARGRRLRRSRLRPLVESFARHLMVAVDAWQEQRIRRDREELSRPACARDAECAATSTRTAICWCAGSQRSRARSESERRSLLRALAQPSWLDPATGGPRR